jgi:hypothetical protein
LPYEIPAEMAVLVSICPELGQALRHVRRLHTDTDL